VFEGMVAPNVVNPFAHEPILMPAPQLLC